MILPLAKHQIKGLNQLPPSDWSYDYEALLHAFIDEAFFAAFVQLQGDQVVGTGNVFVKDAIGWLANIIVDPHYRGRGLGSEMTRYLVDFLNDSGCATHLLIATALGEGVYQRVGFRKQTDYLSFESERDVAYTPSRAVRPLESTDRAAVYHLDREINAENRSHLLDRFFKNGFGYFDSADHLQGFYLPEFGRGLVLSKDEQAGLELLQLKHAENGRRTLLPVENQAGVQLLEGLGLKQGARCSRMVLGKENDWMPTSIYSYGSGYCG